MAHRVDDRWLWLGTGVLLIIAFKSISYAIHDTVRLTEVEPLTTKKQDEDQQRKPEDSLTLEVLSSLATSPNPNISKSAIDLIAARCAKSKSLAAAVQADALSADPELRRKALTAMRFLISWKQRNGIGNSTLHPSSASGGGGVRAVGQIDVPGGGASSSGGTSISGLYEFDDDGHRHAPADATVPWRVARREGGDIGGLSEVELRQRRREAMVLQNDGVEVFGGDDTDYIPPRTVP